MTIEYIFLFLLGISIGSFLTVVAERFDSTESFWQGRSHCNNCKKVLSWWELVPLLGYLLLHGRCSHCRKGIPYLYPVFEIFTGLTFVGLRFAQTNANYWVLAGQLIIASFIIILLIYDWYNQSFPANLLAVTFVVTLAVTLAIMYWAPSYRPIVTINDPILVWLSSPQNVWFFTLKGMIVGLVALGIFAVPSGGRWMGYGDVLLAGILGIWLGYPFVVVGLILAFYLGATAAVWQILTRRVAKNRRIAFGPFLILGAIIVQVWAGALFETIINIWGGI